MTKNHIKGKNINQVDPRHIKTMKDIKTKLLVRDDGIICGYEHTEVKNRAYYTEILHAYKKKIKFYYDKKDAT